MRRVKIANFHVTLLQVIKSEKMLLAETCSLHGEAENSLQTFNLETSVQAATSEKDGS
jgi:hypothetical protein